MDWRPGTPPQPNRASTRQFSEGTVCQSAPRLLRDAWARRLLLAKLNGGIRWSSFDQLIGTSLKHRRNREVEGFGGFQINPQLEPGRLIDRDIAGGGTVEDLVNCGGEVDEKIARGRGIGHQPAHLGIIKGRTHGWQRVLLCQIRGQLAVCQRLPSLAREDGGGFAP